ncbi:MAG: hypothetical protein GY708_24755 [Actinomycetia bacterium]|nr:hypothetical protein [Actinomycetes bacterium]
MGVQDIALITHAGLDIGGITLVRSTTHSETSQPGQHALGAWRQTIGLIFDTLEDQFGLERHGGGTGLDACVE